MTVATARAEAETPLLEFRDASVMLGGVQVLHALDLVIQPGQHTAILGANGSGKSTLVKLIARQLYPLHGATMRIFGREKWALRDLRALIGIVSPAIQRDFTSDERLEVFDAVASGFFDARGLWRHTLTDAMRDAARDALERTGAAHLIGREMASLSTGEARRVLIARALVHKPSALLLDEPCSGLDPASRRVFLESLRGLAREGTTILMVTHHIEEILPEIDHVVLLREGRRIGAGLKAEMLTSAQLSETFAAPLIVERHGDWHWARLN